MNFDHDVVATHTGDMNRAFRRDTEYTLGLALFAAFSPFARITQGQTTGCCYENQHLDYLNAILR
jgi:hypothetical protein